MTLTALMLGVSAAALMILGLALGLELFCFAAAVIALVLLYCAVSILVARKNLTVGMTADTEETLHGEQVAYTLLAAHPLLLPVGQMRAVCVCGARQETHLLTLRSLRGTRETWTRQAGHVGDYSVAVSEAVLTDCFGILKTRCKISPAGRLLVLPRPFLIAKLAFAQSEDAQTALKRATEDTTMPDDIRAWQPGDPMKRVHWKLTARKRELLVRRYESPMPKDTLILTDCAAMPRQADEEREAKLRDALCETVVAVADMQLQDGSPVRVPLYGEHPTEFSAERAQSLLLLQELLAEQSFRTDESFTRVLSQELKRVRRSGAVVIVSPRLDPALTDLALSFRRMGPNVRYYLVTYEAEQSAWLPYIRRMQEARVEVCYVTPAS
ncbi:MAG: DUF58 domain-containing protein [Oscillospiraceae bacterium]|nr:DUF58 domain-containing protein [Clostridia bacterium]MBR0354992.1 DUF58 domain-containing protein [Oscillospiraceae bacterium]